MPNRSIGEMKEACRSPRHRSSVLIAVQRGPAAARLFPACFIEDMPLDQIHHLAVRGQRPKRWCVLIADRWLRTSVCEATKQSFRHRRHCDKRGNRHDQGEYHADGKHAGVCFAAGELPASVSSIAASMCFLDSRIVRSDVKIACL